MGKKASVEHDDYLNFYKKNAEKLGRRFFDLKDKSPDGIEIYLENGKIIANIVEIMHISKGNLQKFSTQSTQKKKLYESLGFDEVKIYQYKSDSSVTKKSLKRVPFNDNFAHTCKQCGEGFDDVSRFQSHIYHIHTKTKVSVV